MPLELQTFAELLQRYSAAVEIVFVRGALDVHTGAASPDARDWALDPGHWLLVRWSADQAPMDGLMLSMQMAANAATEESDDDGG